jgi:hypothetical protein
MRLLHCNIDDGRMNRFDADFCRGRRAAQLPAVTLMVKASTSKL